jgi:hypothetical protein
MNRIQKLGVHLQNCGIFLEYLELFSYWKMHELGSCTRGPEEQCRSMVHDGPNMCTPLGT